jgi:hypothetical protein
MIMSMWRHRR